MMSASNTSTSSLVRYLLLVSLAAAIVCGSSLIATDTKETDLEANTNETDLEANAKETDLKAITTWSYNKCGIERVTVPVNVEGCEETFTKVRVCNGACLSGVVAKLNPPFVSASCSSCQPTRHRSGKKRLLKFMCNGTETLQQVHFPLIRECGCVGRTSPIN